jgi:hypothetical protein
MATQGSALPLLQLPDPCLLVVLQCSAPDNQRSLFSAGRAHSRLHQAAVVALHSIKMHAGEQQQMDNMLQYLDKHGQQVNSIQLVGVECGTVTLQQLPSNLQLTSLHLHHLWVQLQPGSGSHGVLQSVTALRQLRLTACELLDGHEHLAAALTQLPAGLEHPSITTLGVDDLTVNFPTGVLQRLQQLTYLELDDIALQGPCKEQPVLQPVQALTRLQDLRLGTDNGGITASMLSGTHHLTHLEVSGWACHIPSLEPDALAGKTQLQHLQLACCKVLVVQWGQHSCWSSCSPCSS